MKKKRVLNVFCESISITLILFLILTINVKAASFAYKDFDFNEFAENTKNYWGTICEDDEDSNMCIETITKNQKEYYTRLYKILAKYEEKGLHIDDKIIIGTSFFEYSADDLKKSATYNLDSDDADAFNVDKEEGVGYYAQERDTIKLLASAMIGYERVCYGVTEPTKSGSSDREPGNPHSMVTLNGLQNKVNGAIIKPTPKETDPTYVCAQGALRTINNKQVCLSALKTDSIGFAEKYLMSIQSFFGIKKENDYDCSSIATNAGYDESYLEISNKKKVVEEGYWDFLVKSDYFDKKDILRHYYNVVLNKANKKSMSELTDSEKDLYEEDIKNARERIIINIKSVLDIDDKKETSFKNVKSSVTYWWPIGSRETTKSGGKEFANGDPESTNISSKYGMRVDPVTHSYTSLHSGIDITGELGETNIIAVKNGTVVKVYTGCESYGEYTCGSYAGNHVLIMHTDGMYTFYGHLHEGTIKVKEGESVSQGQVIGKMGSSGWSTGPHLHFEVRTGPSSSDAVDPLGYIDPKQPRSSGVSDISKFISYLEGGSNTVICPEEDIPTVGIGITLRYNVGEFAKEGIILTTSYTGDDAYKEYCGQTFDQGALDRIFSRLVPEKTEYVKQELSKHSIELEQYQIDALTSMLYNVGNIFDFPKAYEKYSEDTICESWWHTYAINPGTSNEYGLRLRRKSECHLYTTGDYNPRYGWDNR